MKLRDNAELRSAVRREVNMISDHETPPLVDRILDAVDRALAAPSPGTGEPGPAKPLRDESWLRQLVMTIGGVTVDDMNSFADALEANLVGRRYDFNRRDPAVPAAEPGKPAHDWTSAPGIGWACEHCHSFRRVRGATELSRGFEYQPQNKRKWGPDEPPCARAAEPGKPATCAKCGGTRYYDAGGSTFDYGACPGCTPAAGTAPTPSIPVSTALVCGKCGILSFGSTCSRCGTRP